MLKYANITRLAACIALMLLSLGGFAVAVDYDFTFFATTDVHYGLSPTVEDANRKTIDFMNALPGTAYPMSIGGGVVATPSGVILTGDLTNDSTQAQWNQYAAAYGVNCEGRIRYPVFDGWGNHDGLPTAWTSYIPAQIKLRNPNRATLTQISSNGYHYSWDWGQVHFVHTNVYPGDVMIPDGRYDWNVAQPLYSLQFLKDDLRQNVGGSGRPVIILTHIGFDAAWGLTWWSTQEQQNFYDAIKNYNVIAILQGHTHAAQTFRWNGLDVFSCPAGQRDPKPGECFVFHITQNQLTMVHRFIDRWGSLYAIKAIGIRPNQPQTIADLKDMPDGATVELTDKSVTAAPGQGGVPPNVFYIEELGRFKGIRVASSTPVAVGDTVTVRGLLRTTAGGERYIEASSVTIISHAVLRPLAVNSRTLRGPMMDGLLIRIAGNVKTVGADYFTIVDGYTENRSEVQTTVKTGGAPGVVPGRPVVVTGIASREGTRVILMIP